MKRLSPAIAAMFLAITVIASADNKPEPLLFDPMEGPSNDAPPPSSNSATAAQSGPSFVVPPALQGGSTPLAAAPKMEPVHPQGTPVDAGSLLPQTPAVTPKPNPTRSAGGPDSKVTIYPPHISAAPAPQVSAKPSAPANLNAGFSVDLVSPEQINIQEGVDTIIPISKGHLNRLITPFPHPEVKTADQAATIKNSENVLYVATNEDTPIALYVHDKGHETPTLDLTLIPRSIPPRELHLVTSQATLDMIRASDPPSAAPVGASYVDRIRDEFRAVAQGQVPQGYFLHDPKAADPGVFCMDPTLRIATGQVMEGHDRLILVAQVQNISNNNVEIDETACHQPGVLAVTAWPTPFLKPGQKIELFVARKKQDYMPRPNERPSLIAP